MMNAQFADAQSHTESHPPGYFHMTNLLAPHIGPGQDGLVLPEPPDNSIIKKGYGSSLKPSHGVMMMIHDKKYDFQP